MFQMFYNGDVDNRKTNMFDSESDSIFVYEQITSFEESDDQSLVFWNIDPLPFTVAMFARLAEIGVRTTFVAMALITIIIFKEIEDEIIDLSEDSADDENNKKNSPEHLKCGRKRGISGFF